MVSRIFKYLTLEKKERETERETDRETERQTDRETERDRETDRERQRETDRERDRERQTERDRDRERDREREERERENISFVLAKMTVGKLGGNLNLSVHKYTNKYSILWSKFRTYSMELTFTNFEKC